MSGRVLTDKQNQQEIHSKLNSLMSFSLMDIVLKKKHAVIISQCAFLSTVIFLKAHFWRRKKRLV